MGLTVLFNLISSFDFKVCNDVVTVLTRPAGKSILNHVLCNFSDSMPMPIHNSAIDANFTDNRAVLTYIPCKVELKKETVLRRNTDFDSMRNKLLESLPSIAYTDSNDFFNKA